MTDLNIYINQMLQDQYGITATLTRLAGENENYLVESNENMAWVLKLADEETTTGMIEIEHMAVESLIETGITLSLPRVIPTHTQDIEAHYKAKDGTLIRGRLLAFVNGVPWCSDVPASNERLEDLGHVIGKTANALSHIIHPATKRTHHWDLAQAGQHRSSITVIEDIQKQAILEQVFLWFDAIALPKLPYLATGPIHGDINDDNVLILGNKVAGLLDFGDCLENPLICELAIALAYHTLDEPEPLEAAALIIKAYHKERALCTEELEVLFPLMCARLAVSVIISAKRRELDADRDSWFVSEERAWNKLEEFVKIAPAAAARTLASGINKNPVPKPYPNKGLVREILVEKRKNCIAPSLSLSYNRPIKMVKGQGQFLYDESGRPFLDLYNNVCHLGHCHPHVVEAGQKQMAQLNTNTRYLYDGLTDYARRLTATLPDELDTCFFVNSGSEANELALRIAKTVTAKEDVLVVENAYHGHTQAMIHISPYKFMGKGGKGKPEPWVHVVPVADGYRGKHKGKGSSTGKAYGDEVGKIIEKTGRPVAAFITESLLSCGGQVIPPKDYFKTAFAHVRKNGGLCICDEVQTGFGRTGNHFWAFEGQDVVPDIVVLGKPMGNGHPMAAVVTTRTIADKFANGMEFFATFGGNPVSCAIGTAVLEVIEKDNLQSHAKAVGTHFLDALMPLKERHPLIGDIRGIGLFIGIELVRDRKTIEPATTEAGQIVNQLRDQGILTGTDGPFDNVIKIKPPIIITKDDADMFARTLDRILFNFN
ncbi:MAG: aminotransferase class III-fold pyridoxal phosphate-dependent enzyme [Desulfobacterales bacterium]|nr:aminotransferase class III-fold pyridoxal phosphate-dependent enzyme [Desulfobacterales bacterium]